MKREYKAGREERMKKKKGKETMEMEDNGRDKDEEEDSAVRSVREDGRGLKER